MAASTQEVEDETPPKKGSYDLGLGKNKPLESEEDIVVPPEVLEADHGLRADGGVGGLTLAERVAFGAKAGGSVSVVAPAATITNVLPSYTKRNARVVAAQAAGKSRWGPLETERIQKLVSLPAGSTDSPPAAGVNLGARLLAKK